MTESHDEELEYESWGECKADEATLYECNMEIWASLITQSQH